MNGAEVASLISAINGKDDRNDGFFGDGIWGIIMLLIVAGIFTGGWGGFGSFGRNGAIANDTLLSDEFIKRDIFNTNQNVSTTGCQTQRDVLENRYTNQLGVQSIISSQKDCCCETNRNIDSVKYDNLLTAKDAQMQLADCCCRLEAGNLANTQKILDKLCENEINQLRTDLQSAQLQISQLSQTANITNALRPYPTPAYLTCSPYMSSIYAYNGFNNCGGCGCNNLI